MIELNSGVNAISGYYGLELQDHFNGTRCGNSNETKDYLQSVLISCKAQLVIDADAINLIAAHPELRKHLPKNSILTPTPKNLRGLLDHGKRSR